MITSIQLKSEIEWLMPKIISRTHRDERVAARWIMKTCENLEKLCGKRYTIEQLFFDESEEYRFLPLTICDIAREYVARKTSESDAKRMMHETSKQYKEIFREMGFFL